MKEQKPRILLYSHDTYGLGHIRRTMAISQQIAVDIPKSQQLIMTGSSISGAFELPPRTEVIKLPGLSKRSTGEYKARTLPLKLEKMIKWRKQMLAQAVDFFAPDIVLVDKAPAGAQQELLPVITKLKLEYPDTKLVLGMRDIEDSPDRTIQQWKHNGSFQLMESAYDLILLYGQLDFFDTIAQYRLSPTITKKMVEVGYISRPFADDAITEDLFLPSDKPLVLVTVGGGGDGFDIISDYLDMVETWDEIPFHSLIVTGPLMAERFQARLEKYDHPEISIINFTPNLMHYMDDAQLIISMAGYNSCVELMSLNKKAILIPRNTIREEQRIRAEMLADNKMAYYFPRSEMGPERLRTAITDYLDAPSPRMKWRLDGLTNTTAALSRLLTCKQAPIYSFQSLTNSTAVNVSLPARA